MKYISSKLLIHSILKLFLSLQPNVSLSSSQLFFKLHHGIVLRFMPGIYLNITLDISAWLFDSCSFCYHTGLQTPRTSLSEPYVLLLPLFSMFLGVFKAHHPKNFIRPSFALLDMKV